MAYQQRPLSDEHARPVRLHWHSGSGRGLERMAVGIMTTAQGMLDADPATVTPGFLEQVKWQARTAKAAQQAKRARKAMGQAEGRRHTYLDHSEQLAEKTIGVFTSLGVAKRKLPPFAQGGGLLEYLCDALEEIATRKGCIGQLLFDKWRQLYKVMPPKQVFSLPRAVNSDRIRKPPLRL
jgi:hypothetical protein